MLYRNQTDETLVMLTLMGEQQAFEALVIRYQETVISAATSVTRNRFMAEDAAQDAFVTAWMKLDSLKDHKKFAAWVCRIAKNCALNTVTRYQSFISVDDLISSSAVADQGQNPAELYTAREDADELHKTIGALPKRVAEIINLHYFEGLSIAEIADITRLSEGTVKWHLHDGRKRIRKELCAMSEKWNDTLVQRVMKKVEELKLWRTKNDKSEFEVIYRDVLRDVEELPESKDKYHALADVLMSGWWWLPGEKNDALFARIRDAAERGKNDEVMEFIVGREDSKVYGGARIDFILNKQIPRLEAAGLVKTLAHEWFALGKLYYKDGKTELGREAYIKARTLLSAEDVNYSLVPRALEIEELHTTQYKDKDSRKYILLCRADELRIIDGKLTWWKTNSLNRGEMYSGNSQVNDILRNCAYCDSIFFAELSLGESFTGSDGSTLTFVSDNESLHTPCGDFDGCHLYEVRYFDQYTGASVYKTYYKHGVGIVRHEHILDGISDARVLSAYKIAGGSGLLPLCEGNRWEYVSEYNESAMRSDICYEVSYADSTKSIVTSTIITERFGYDENSWLDMIVNIRNEYWGRTPHGNQGIRDIYDVIDRAEALAKTPMEKAHSKAACSVARRILDTDPDFNKDHTATGHWNFFKKSFIRRQDGIVIFGHNSRWSFEWKHMGTIEPADTPLLYNDILGILQDATGCIWSDQWKVGDSPTAEFILWDNYHMKTEITCEKCDPITTKAGHFEDCIKLSLKISGLENSSGLKYRGGNKEYYFANGVGIVRTVNEYCGGARKAVYDLTYYEGTGDGYMPIYNGLSRRYDALDLTDGFVGATDYSFVEDSDGQIYIFSDQTGIRNIPAPTTSYSAIQNEMLEEKLYDGNNNIDRVHRRHATNNFHLMLHYLARPTWHRMNATRSAEICKFNMEMMESFGDGKLPDAWVGLYAWTAIVRAAAWSGKEDKNECYKWLDIALTYFEKWASFKTDELLDTGNIHVFGNAKLVKGKALLCLSDGTREPVS